MYPGFFIQIDRQVSNVFRQLSPHWIIGIALLLSVLMVSLSEIVLNSGRDFIIPPSWDAFDDQVILLTKLISPSASLITAGLFFGSLSEWAAARDTPRYLPGGSLINHGERYLLGMAGLIVIYGFIGIMIHGRTRELAILLPWIRGALLGFWITYGAPLLFIRMKLSPGPGT